MQWMTVISIWMIPFIICGILLYGTYKKIPTYETFVEGGKEGIQMSFAIIPYLVGMLVAISVFRASGALEFFVQFLRPFLEFLHVPAEIVPLAIIRPISGTAALGMTSDLIAVYGPDSFIGRLAATIQGSTDTTFYVLTVYFGAVGIKKMGDALKVGLLADLVGLIAAIVVVTFVFGVK
ncbi:MULTISPECIES: spore maturation protein [Bacillaceae]|uniref:Spore maturation protein B n=1 Tax=Peribacillus huizhouensis TaxID=1501239 RepID=A0ABR6CQD3_9BACI|nr:MULTISPECIES: spore maturation protein [Bacillaceae]MBA9027248.1 spore maturation protein B [Peribacillus huizhouensis]